ncbi:MAG: GspH/FimT family pseudopilin [Pseudomonadota bacterium]
MKDRGFTLIEMVIVLILIGLSISLVAPSLSRISKTIELRAAVKKVSAILRYYRSEAVQTGKIQQVLFDPDLREVRIYPIDINIPEGEKEKREERQEPLRKFPLPEGIQMKELNFPVSQHSADSPTIEFYPNGGSNGGSLLLDRQDHKGYRIKVNFLTGMVEVGGG